MSKVKDIGSERVNLCSQLRSLLERAEDGEIVGFAYAAETEDGYSNSWGSCEGSSGWIGLLGAIEVLKSRLIEESVERE